MKRIPAMHEITPGVWFGRKPGAREAAKLVSEGGITVLDLTAEGNEPAVIRERADYHNLPLLDLVNPAPGHIEKAIGIIRENQPRQRVLVHCQLGLQRSAIVAAHWLVASKAAGDLDEAKRRIRELEPRVVF